MTSHKFTHFIIMTSFNRNAPMSRLSLPEAQMGNRTKEGEWNAHLCGCRGSVSRRQSRGAGEGDTGAGLQCHRGSASPWWFSPCGWLRLTLLVPSGSACSLSKHAQHPQTSRRQNCKCGGDRPSLLCLCFSYDHSVTCGALTGARGHLPAGLPASGECSPVWFTFGSPVVTTSVPGPSWMLTVYWATYMTSTNLI